MNREKITEEWEHFKKAPISIIISVLMISIVIWLFLDQFVYKKRLEDKNSTIELLSRQVSIYKDKKFIVGETTYSNLNNEELKTEAQRVYNKLLSMYLQYKSFDTLDHYSKNLSWEQSSEISNRQSHFGRMMVDNYENIHLVEVILLREELLLRLPQVESKKSDLFRYQHPTNPLVYKDILDDFNALILKLPIK